MDNDDMSNIMDKISTMMKNGQIPDDVKDMINNLNINSNSESKSSSSSSENTSTSEFDIKTILKMKSIMDTMKSNSNDPRANLLRSLKPYLKESRKSKVDQYIQFFNIGKIFEHLNPLGGDNSK